jgi:outer membrane protein assembly factor BamA
VNRKRKSAFTLSFSVIFAMATSGTVSQPVVVAFPELHGALPPGGTGLYACIQDLNGKPYSEEGAAHCLQSLRAASFVQQATLKKSLQKNGQIQLIFVLEGRKLDLHDIKIKTAESDREPLDAWLKKIYGFPHPGQPYDEEAREDLFMGVWTFYSTRGRSVLLTPIIRFNYSEGTASVEYLVNEGPRVPATAAVPPYGPSCKDRVGAVDWNGIDEDVPVSFVEEIFKKWDMGACFSEEAFRIDQRRLENSELFTIASAVLSGAVGDREISLHVEGKPLQINEVTQRVYSISPILDNRPHEELPLQAAQIYTRKKAKESEDILKKFYTRPGWVVEVVENDEISSNGMLHVTLSVLASESVRFFVDGKRIGE